MGAGHPGRRLSTGNVGTRPPRGQAAAHRTPALHHAWLEIVGWGNGKLSNYLKYDI